MCQKNLISCEALPCFFWHENLHILVELHQDDFCCTAPAESLMWLREELKDEIRLTFSEMVYPSMHYNHLKANRLVTSQGTLIVASSRNITDVVQKCSGAPTPITLVRCGNPEADGQLLEAEVFRRWLALLGFENSPTRHWLRSARTESSSGCSPGPRFRTLQTALSQSEQEGLGCFFQEDPDGFSIGSLQ